MTSRSSSIGDWAAATPVLAHQGGWDEALYVAIPILVIVALLGVARRRADRLAQRRDEPPPDH